MARRGPHVASFSHAGLLSISSVSLVPTFLLLYLHPPFSRMAGTGSQKSAPTQSSTTLPGPVSYCLRGGDYPSVSFLFCSILFLAFLRWWPEKGNPPILGGVPERWGLSA